LVESSLRNTDTLFRFGGEEFMVILPETDLDEAYEIADRMRLLVEKNDFGLELKTTISIGVVVFKDGDSVDSIISKVDTLLYHSKDEGRNSISKASE
jgi:diguanylate cyclase (GGDEF)-like protein